MGGETHPSSLCIVNRLELDDDGLRVLMHHACARRRKREANPKKFSLVGGILPAIGYPKGMTCESSSRNAMAVDPPWPGSGSITWQPVAIMDWLTQS